ncbi:MAG: hypothetical protein ABIQ02_01720 [Saprospiraceae bacterium]
MKKKIGFFILTLALGAGCQKDPVTRMIDNSYQPVINAAKFPNPTNLTNPYYLLEVGKVYHLEGQTADGFEVVEEQRSTETKIILGITCVVGKFVAKVDNVIIEQADDWYAQDIDGNLWYFGEYVNNYSLSGVLENHNGSWEAGVDGAKPGIAMPANPTLGMKYREEYYFNNAEDEAEITAVNLDVTTPFGHFTNCIETKNYTALEPTQIEHKIYAPGVGLIKEIEPDNAEILLTSIH